MLRAVGRCHPALGLLPTCFIPLGLVTWQQVPVRRKTWDALRPPMSCLGRRGALGGSQGRTGAKVPCPHRKAVARRCQMGGSAWQRWLFVAPSTLGATMGIKGHLRGADPAGMSAVARVKSTEACALLHLPCIHLCELLCTPKTHQAPGGESSLRKSSLSLCFHQGWEPSKPTQQRTRLTITKAKPKALVFHFLLKAKTFQTTVPQPRSFLLFLCSASNTVS